MKLLVHFTFSSERPRLLIPKFMQRFHKEPRADMWKLLASYMYFFYPCIFNFVFSRVRISSSQFAICYCVLVISEWSLVLLLATCIFSILVFSDFQNNNNEKYQKCQILIILVIQIPTVLGRK